MMSPSASGLMPSSRSSPTNVPFLHHLVVDGFDADLLAVDAALRELADIEPRAVQVVECRFFGGLSVEETGEALGVSVRTVKRDWILAKAWLHRKLQVVPR
jgi:DNA-directed RNA polymerase specialized sigma24 family protein